MREEIGGEKEILVRKLQESDIEAIAEIEADSFSLPWSPQDFADLLGRNDCTYLVAEVDGVLAGSCGMTTICQEGNIDNVVVAKTFRGMGVAQKLLQELLTRGEADGVEAFTLEVRVSNAPAIHVYEKMGFVSEGIRPGFYEKPVEDAMIMWRR